MMEIHQRPSDYDTFKQNEKTTPEGTATEGFTYEETIEHIGVGWYQLKIGLILGLGLVTFIGFLIGGPLFGILSDHHGRTTALFLSAMWLAYFALLCSFSPLYVWVLILRCLTGLGVGGGTQAYAYFAEIVPSYNRGRLYMGIMFTGSLGGSVVICLALLFMRFGWRYWLMSTTVPIIIYIVLLRFIPPSPKYELACGRDNSARKILENIAESNNKKLPEGRLLSREIKERGKLTDLVKPKLQVTSILLAIIWTTCLCSYYSMILLTTELIKRKSTCSEVPIDSGGCPRPLTSSDFLEMLGTSCGEIPVLLILAAFVDKVGRKVSWYISGIIFGSSCLVLCVCLSGIPMLLILSIGRSCAACLPIMAYLYTAEVYPTEVRGLAVGMGTGFGRIGALLSPFIAQVLLSQSIPACMSVLFLIAFATLVLVFLLPQDLSGKVID